MKWLLLALSLYALSVAFAALFLVPGNYDWFNFVAAGIALSVAAVLARLSIKRFKRERGKQPQAEDPRPPSVPLA